MLASLRAVARQRAALSRRRIARAAHARHRAAGQRRIRGAPRRRARGARRPARTTRPGSHGWSTRCSRWNAKPTQRHGRAGRAGRSGSAGARGRLRARRRAGGGGGARAGLGRRRRRRAAPSDLKPGRERPRAWSTGRSGDRLGVACGRAGGAGGRRRWRRVRPPSTPGTCSNAFGAARRVRSARIGPRAVDRRRDGRPPPRHDRCKRRTISRCRFRCSSAVTEFSYCSY